MIRHDFEQGSPEWIVARLGIPTASNFSRIVTKGGKLSASAAKYKAELIAEWLLGEPMDDMANSEWMQRGTELEEMAVRYYELLRDCEVDRVGFVTTDDGLIGCSPDGLVGDDCGLEIKTPGAAKHVANMLSMPDEYRQQVQGGLWVCERDKWDFLSFNPSIRPAVKTWGRDDKYIEILSSSVREFVEDLQATKEQFMKDGHAPREVTWK